MIKSYGFFFLEYNVDKNMKDMDYETFKKEVELNYDPNKKQWVYDSEYTGDWYPATFTCHSLKAALRHLRKHDEIPKGSVFRLVSKYIGFDIFLIKK